MAANSQITRRNFVSNVVGSGAVAVIGNGLLNADPAEVAAPRAELASLSGKRVFFARFSHETNTFHPQPTRTFSIVDPKPGDKPLMLDVWQQRGLSVVPGVSAWPAGGGTVNGKSCRAAMARVIESLRASLPVDAVFLGLHGAMYADGVGPAETVLVEEVRRAVGPKVPIACTFDLHGNIPARLGEAGDILVGFKTAPHTDQKETAEHAGRLLLATLRGTIHPVSYALPIPIIVQGEKAMTTAEPFHSLVEEARRVEREGVPGHAAKILAATLFVGCAWTDSHDTGMSVVITADGSKQAARAAAVHLARRVWEARKQFTFGCETAELEEGVTRAIAAKETTVFLSDSGDNVTASTPGDLSLVLQHLVQRKVPSAVVAGVWDEEATRRCHAAGEGKSVHLTIGATVEKRFGPPLDAEVEVVRLIPGMAVVRLGKVDAVLSSHPVAFTDPAQFQACGIDPLSRKIVVVKEGYLYPKLRRIAPRHIMLLTPGSGDMRIEKLSYVRRRKPMFPFEADTPFAPE
jgi:microcystin degradation protein MlrC